MRVTSSGYFAATAACTALYERQQSGLGQHIDIGMHECMGFTIESSAPWALYEQHPLIRQAGRHAGPQPTEPWQYPTADGRLINIFGMPRSEASWLALVAFIQERGMGENLSDLDLLDGRKRQLGLQQPTVATMLADIADFIAAHDAEEIYAGAQAAGAAWSIIRMPDECLADEHWHARGFFVDVEHEERNRTVTFPGAPYILSETPWTHVAAPRCSENTPEKSSAVSSVSPSRNSAPWSPLESHDEQSALPTSQAPASRTSNRPVRRVRGRPPLRRS